MKYVRASNFFKLNHVLFAKNKFDRTLFDANFYENSTYFELVVVVTFYEYEIMKCFKLRVCTKGLYF